jgi:hypothetical protein
LHIFPQESGKQYELKGARAVENSRTRQWNVFYALAFLTDPVVATVSPMLAHNYFASLGINVELED